MIQPVGRLEARRRCDTPRLGTHRRRHFFLYTAFWSLALSVLALANVITTENASAAPANTIPADASCAVLSRVDASATNGGVWGKTILPGHNVPGGWFGVDVCANGTNTAAPNGSNVSCDRLPKNWSSGGCAPGVATGDGYGLTYQCVELVIRFSAWAYGDQVSDWGRLGWGNAPDLWLAGNHPSDFAMYPNGASTPPVPGDILVWGAVDAKGQPWPAGPDGEHGGHIAVVAAVHGGVVVTAEQNVKWGNVDHPSDTLALTQVGGHWILSGSTARQTTLPTYRWRGAMGTSRATYGWLHSVKNTGEFPSKQSGKVSTPTHRTTTTPTQTPPKQSPGGLPSLSQGVFVANGGLSDLVWSTSGLFESNSSPNAPSARARSLAAPPGVKLADGQRPAVVMQSDGKRFVYVVGTDGHLYEAVTTPLVLGVQWQDLGSPDNAPLEGSASAVLFTGGIALAALGDDGNLWWRAGPAGNLGGWLELGRPSNVTLSGAFVLLAAPGLGAPMVLALSKAGALYQRVWQPALLDQAGDPQAPAGWSDWVTPHATPAGVRLIGPLLTSYEATAERATVAPWLGAALDVFAADDTGHVWLLRAATQAMDWTQIALLTPARLQTLIAVSVTQAVADPGQVVSSALELHLYANTASGLMLGVIALPTRGSSALGSAAWSSLSLADPTPVESAEATALAIGPANSALLLTTRGSVSAAVDAVGTQALQPSDSATTQPTFSGARWLTLGAPPSVATFNDSLTSPSLDAHWTQAGTHLSSHMTPNGVQLLVGANGAGALLQSASPGDAAVEARITLPSDVAGAQRAGLVIYLDDSDWITLTVDAQGHASFCVAAAGVSAPCMTRQITLTKTSRVVWAQLARSEDTYSGLVSPDQGGWIAVGQWTTGGSNSQTGSPTTTPATPSTVTPSSTNDTTPARRPVTLYGVASLGFTEWGIYVQGAGSSAPATFADFVTTPLPVNTGT